MRYYSVSFFYPGPRDNSGEDESAAKNAAKAEAEVRRRLTDLSCDMRHEYSWPDGTLYLYVRTPMTSQELRDAFGSADGIHINNLEEIKPTGKPEQYGLYKGKTIEEIFQS